MSLWDAKIYAPDAQGNPVLVADLGKRQSIGTSIKNAGPAVVAEGKILYGTISGNPALAKQGAADLARIVGKGNRSTVGSVPPAAQTAVPSSTTAPKPGGTSALAILGALAYSLFR